MLTDTPKLTSDSGAIPQWASVEGRLSSASLDVVDMNQPGDHRIVVSRPGLIQRLGAGHRVTVVAAPAGSGKTWLMHSWIAQAKLGEAVAWVSVERVEQDPTRFWISVVDALRETRAGSAVVQELEPAPSLEGEAIVKRLARELTSLEKPLLLVIDDLHELRSSEARRQFELFVSLAPPQLRFVIATRFDRLPGLHRLRIEGELTELRTDDLRFSLDETKALFDAAGVPLSDSMVVLLHERTEGWAAGLRLAALSLAGHPDPEGFAAEFYGSERTVADYLLAEVLERQPEEVRQLLLRTSFLERVNGPLADLLTGDSGGERVLQDLEDAGAFVVSLDGQRSWFRYHHLLADLLQAELRRTLPDELPGLRSAAAGWLAEHGYPIEAARQAQAAEDWGLAVRILSDRWFELWLGGQGATVHELLKRFPPGVRSDPELCALLAADELTRGSVEEAEVHLTRASHLSGSVPDERRDRLEVWLTIGRLGAGRRRGDLETVLDEADRTLALLDAADTPEPDLRDEQRALALIELGTAEAAAGRPEDAEGHLERALTLAHRSGQAFLEVSAVAELASVAMRSGFLLVAERARQAIELAQRHGWSDEPIVADAYALLGLCTVLQGRLDEAEPWLDRAERTLPPDGQPVIEGMLRTARAQLELARGRETDALAAIRAGERALDLLVAPETVVIRRGGAVQLQRYVRGLRLQILVRLGETERVELTLDNSGDEERESPEMRIALTVLRLAQDDPEAARLALDPVLDNPVLNTYPGPIPVLARLLSAIVSDALGDAGAAGRALESALDYAEPESMLLPFLLYPAPALLERHQRHHTSHASLVSEIRGLLAGRTPTSLKEPEPLDEPLSESETRVLRYLPSNLSAPEIAGELFLSVSTIKTHMQHIYRKLGVHSRADAVERARALRLLAPSSLAAR
jgi:LuxR family transcriptional regulator, maltose regulon positive regulatory protein